MALLPLAGWAATDISSAVVNLNRTSLDYVGAVNTVPAIQSVTVGDNQLTETTDYTVSYKQLVGETWTDKTADQIKDAGSYQLILTGVTNYVGTKVVPFTIAKRALEMTLKDQAATKVYGENDPTTLDYTWTNASQIQGQDNVNNLQLTWTLERENGEDVGTYAYKKAKVEATNYTINIVGASAATLKITQATLNATYTGTLTKVYGEKNPDLPNLDKKENNNYVYTITGWKGEDADKFGVSLFKNQAVTYTVEDLNANYNVAGTTKLDDDVTNNIVITEITSLNYKVVFTPIELKISQANLAIGNAGAYSFAFGTGIETTQSKTYNAESLAPDVALVYTTSNNGTLNPTFTGDDADLELSYAVATPGDANHKTVGVYTVSVKAKGATGNYSGTFGTPITFNIAKRTIYSFIDVENKVYDKTAIDEDDVEISLSNVAKNDKTGATAITAALFTFDYTVNANTNNGQYENKLVGDYEIEPKLKAQTEETAATLELLNANYNIEPSTAQFAIIARPVTITAKPQTVEYNKGIKQLDSNDKPLYTVQSATGQGAVEGEGLIDGDDLGTITLVLAADKSTYTARETPYREVILVTNNATGDNPDWNTNYSFNPVAGDLTVNGTVFSLIAKPVTYTYDGTNGYRAKFDFTTSGINKNLIDASKVTYKVLDYETEEELDEDPVNADDYKVIAVLAPGDVPDNYTLDAPVPGDLTIEQLALTITPGVIEINNGATANDLNALGAGKVLFKDADENEYEIPYTLSFAAGITVTEGKLNEATAGVKSNGYLISAKEGEDYSNYEIDWTTAAGDLNVFIDVIVLDRTADDLRAKLTAAHNKTYTVRFKNERILNAKKWYSMILPFEISVAKLSNFLGYAIVNLLDETATDGNVHFYLTMDKIPANKPFLVKAVDDNENVDLNYAATTNERQIANIKIIDPAAETKTVTSTGVEFTGVFKKEFLLSSGDKFYTGQENDKFYKVGANETKLNPFASFWRAAANARVFVEDLDENGATVIKEISAQTMSEIATDGWYTLNGMKLQSVPTEKGVYIHNGKKVVLK